ncbi:ThuA domain-containing protein [Mucilaginibacter auburnensis]|uniref:Glucose/arabinose dehydrogenase n=1 Tax=Mucilaginibacter auburnensis TaxID=1457233 RepID=A0A2H9VVR1_9SPHI|nr:ThuA domain-containing protein [Mucilaginibacter auburnensis]PJJ84879.1 glucose/arabinose dehydrogenase [Mucilaginibacter auburnensis]
MRINFFGVARATLVCMLCAAFTASAQKRVLVFTKVAAFPHDSRPAAAQAIMKMGKENNFGVDTTSDATKIAENNLKRYDAVIFVSTTGDLLTPYQRVDLQRYLQAGGGFVGIHAAADALYDWKWYGRMIGGYFAYHPTPQPATMTVVDKNHPSTSMLPTEWKRTDEWYHFKNFNKSVKVLINLEESSLTYRGNPDRFKMGPNHPIAWYHDFDGGKVFYTGLGHTKESYSEDLVVKHILGGIKYAMDHPALNYSKAKAQHAPDENRFTKSVLAVGKFTEPTEMTILPNLDILIVQRRGEILKYTQATKTLKQVAKLDVYFKELKKATHPIEDGLLGIQADPDYKTNNYVYVYYSPASPDNKPVNYLSRFTFKNDVFDLKSEKRILEVKTDRETCCHTGGSIAFGKDHELFLSTGDNTSPFDEENVPKGAPNTNSFAPLDDRPGFETNDDRRAAGNSNDLRGKILRIKIKPDGTYEIPEGNLFAKGTAGTRPEIYVMGNRNPYRITIDPKTQYLYWGEVGPDARADSMATRGPKGYDEVNQARKAGNFGWPYLIGPNLAYHEYNYATGTSGAAFDPLKPVNNSRNNTGLKELPPGQPAFIWYPYDASPDFPQVGTGGRTAMAGPVYHGDMYKTPGLPAYYNGKLLIYEWIRGWIKAVTLTPEGDYDNMEPFMENTKFNSPVDMEVGPDGKLYVLEYGNGWFAKNPDAALSRIDYSEGNLPPQVTSVAANKTAGVTPFTVTLTAKATDAENDKIVRYNWNLGNGVKKVTTTPTLTYTYTAKGNFTASVTASDAKGTGKSKTVALVAGASQASVAAANAAKANDPGRVLMMSLDCPSCHKVDEKSIGPAFVEVAKKYEHNATNTTKLSQKIINGGGGVWGDVIMPAHSALKPEQAKQIVNWVFSLAPAKK